MPELRLERTRHPRLEVPPCVRLGHLMRVVDVMTGLVQCVRCRLTDPLEEGTPIYFKGVEIIEPRVNYQLGAD